ncbi:MAG: hypothetical protein ACRDNJ_02065 [Solirubrobacteraceae bacterium]
MGVPGDVVVVVARAGWVCRISLCSRAAGRAGSDERGSACDGATGTTGCWTLSVCGSWATGVRLG